MERILYAYEYVRQPFDAIVELLSDTPEKLFQSATDSAHGQAGTLVEHLHVDVSGFDLGRDVTIEIDDREPLGMHTVKFPLRWHAAESAGLFPEMSGQLEVAAMSFSAPLCQVTFSGHYRPPFGGLGVLADAGLGRRVADAAVHQFVKDICARIEREIAGVEQAVR